MFRSREQQEFHDRMAAHAAEPDAPLLLEGTAGLGKTRPMAKLALGVGRRTAIGFPSHALIDQFLSSTDLAAVREVHASSVFAFRPRHMIKEAGEDFEAHRAQALKADLLLCTSSSIIIDQRLDGGYNGATARDLIIFDEADQLPQLAALVGEFEIPSQLLRDLGIRERTPLAALDQLLATRTLPETRAAAKVIREVLTAPEVWYRRAGFTDDGGLALYHRLPGRLLKRISNRPSTVFVSATLSVNGTFRDFKRAMGIEAASRFSTRIEPESHGKLTFDFHLDHAVETPAWKAAVIEQIRAAVGNTLVVTPSHALAEQLGAELAEALVRGRDESTAEAVRRMDTHRILIAAGAWAGLDAPIQWNTIVIPRVPFLGPKHLTDEWQEPDDILTFKDAMVSYLDSRNMAIRRMRQVFGRGLRRPDAECWVVICDPRILSLGEQVAPARFRIGWLEGRIISETQTVSERNPQLRRDALRHYGHDCMALRLRTGLPAPGRGASSRSSGRSWTGLHNHS